MKKLRGVFLIVFVVSALALALVACSETAITEHVHQWSEWSVDTATCAEGGTQTRTCTREGCTTQDGKPATQTRTTNALGHNVTSWALCESDHSKHEGVCSRPGCGVTVTEAHHANAAGTECVDCGEALGSSEQCLHPNASATSETAATCTSAKIEHWTCPDCVWTEDRYVGAALGHDYTDVAWTPVAGGKHERECARGCGDKQTEACDNKGVITGTAPTCEAAGCANGTKCSVCGGNEVLGAVINALGHAWGEWSADTATCTEGGTQTRYCERIGCDTNNGQRAEDTRTTDARGHDEYKDFETAATCTANKIEHWACHRCDWTDDKEIADTALDHDYTDVAWTAVAGGTHQRECTRCDYVDSADCDSNGVIDGTAPTCETAGRENGTKCSVCGGNETLGEVIAALGHDEYIVDETAATCTANKVEHWACHRCDWKEDKVIAESALGHAWSEWSEDTATCTEGGTQTRTCTHEGCDTNDGEPATETRTTAALGHDEYIVDETAATCTANKVEHWACHNCNWTDDKEIADTALGHNYTDVAWTAVAGGTHERECARGCGDKQTGTCDSNGVIDGTAATCETAGRENGTKCSVCDGNQTLGEVINAFGHSLSVASTTAATCTAAKVNHMACSRCDYTEDQTEGNALGHDYAGGVWTAVDDGTHHAQQCSRCDAFDLDNKHAAEWGEYGLTADETQHYQVCNHCNVQSTPVDHSATTYTYASNGEHSGLCACGKALTEKCELADDSNACSVCGRIVGSVNGVGDFTIDFSTYGSSTIDPMTDIEIDGVTISFAKGSSSTNPRYWASDKGMRTYKGNSLTVTAPKGGKITSIVFTGTFSSNSAGYNSSSKTWAGSGETVTLEITGSSNFTKMAITFESVELCYHDDKVVSCSQSAATCEGTGILQDCFRCESCNLYFTTDACTEILENAVVDALGHTYGEWIDEVVPTCAAAGTKGHFHCDACGTDFDSEKVVLEDLTIAINPDNHSNLSAVAKQDPTCENAGWYAHYECDGCGKKYETEDATAEYDPAIEALGHDLQYRANGTDKHEQYCTRGDYVGEAEEHVATTWVAAINGHYKVCTVCGLDFNEGGHSYTDGKCVCGMEEAHEHNYTGTVTKQPTCTENGVTTYACDGCDDTYTEDIDALGHNFTGGVLPITGDETYHATKCSRCDAFDVANKEECDYTEETVDADGHHTACVCGRIGSTTPHEYAAATQTCSCGKINPTYLVFVRNPEIVATFEMGTKTSNVDGSAQSSYTETAGSYTLTITKTNGSIYPNSGDGTNSVLKVGTSSAAAEFSFSVPNNIGEVVIYVARYNAGKEIQLTINGNNVESPTSTEYIPIRVDTSSVKEIVFGTSKYCRIDKIVYYCVAENYSADESTARVISAANCTDNGEITFKCTIADCEETHSIAIPALGHTYGDWIDEVAPTCTATGTKGHFHCDVCGADLDSEENGYAVLDDLTIAIAPNNHVGNLTHVDAKAPTTCDTADTEHAGHVEYWQCACGVMYADANRNTVIDSLEFSYLDHTREWDKDMSTDFGHSGECSVCHEIFIDEQHVWDEDNKCTICGYEKPAGKHYITTVIIVDGAQVAGIPAGVTLTWDPADTNGAFDKGATPSFTISLSGYNLVSVVMTDSIGNEPEDWIEDDGEYAVVMEGDYTLTITIVSIPTAVVNYSVDNATVTVTDSNGTTINNGDRVLVGTELTITVTADQGYEVKSVTVNSTAITDGKYTVAETDTAITIAATLEEKSNDPVLVATITATAMGYGTSYQDVTKTINGYTITTTKVMKQNGSTGNLQLQASNARITITGGPISKIEIVYSSGGKNITVKVGSTTISKAAESTDSLWIYEVSVSDSETLTISNGTNASYISEIRIYA